MMTFIVFAEFTVLLVSEVTEKSIAALSRKFHDRLGQVGFILYNCWYVIIFCIDFANLVKFKGPFTLIESVAKHYKFSLWGPT